MKQIFTKRWVSRWTWIFLAAGIAGLLAAALNSPGKGQAAAIQWPAISLQLVTSGTPSPVSISHADDQSGRLYIVNQGGTIQVIVNGQLQTAPFLDIHTLISCCGERGLLGLAFPSNYTSKGHFFVYYTNKAGNIVIARYQVSAIDNMADPSSGVIVLTISHRASRTNRGYNAIHDAI